MRFAILIAVVLLSGCTFAPRDDMRVDLGCRVVRNPKTEKIEHFHCDRRLPIQFEYRF